MRLGFRECLAALRRKLPAFVSDLGEMEEDVQLEEDDLVPLADRVLPGPIAF